MNLLIFVLSFLLLMASISYQGLAHFKTNALVRIVWDRFIRIEEPCAYNHLVEDQYKKLKSAKGKPLKPKELEDMQKKEDEAAKGASGINFRFLVDPTYPSAHPEQTEQMEVLIKKLILLFYGDQPFFQKIYSLRPTVIDEMLQNLRAANEELSEKTKIGSKKKLAQFTLKDPSLEALWFQLRRQNPVSTKVIELLTNQSEQELKKNADAPCFNVDLMDYLSNSNVQQLRIYLAARPLLLVLLEDSLQVNELLAKRKELHNEVSKKTNPMSQDDAMKELQNFCQKFPSLSSFDAIINYKVTTTNPSDYE